MLLSVYISSSLSRLNWRTFLGNYFENSCYVTEDRSPEPMRRIAHPVILADGIADAAADGSCG